MTSESAPRPGDDPRELLAGARELTQRVRRAQRATWFPLLVFAAVTFAAIPIRRYGGHLGVKCQVVAVGPGEAARHCVAYTTAGVYLPVALVLGYAVIAVFYVRRSPDRGIGTPVRPYVIAGIAAAALGTGMSVLDLRDPSLLGGPQGTVLTRLATNAAGIGLALLVLAWVEHNPALLVLTAGYLAVVVVPLSFGWHLAASYPGNWAFLPGLAHRRAGSSPGGL